jgi:DME family drug/metabolite transporter
VTPDSSVAHAPSSSKSYLGPFLIGIAACLWATDPLFRAPTVQVVHPMFMVLFEHAIGTLLLGLWCFLRKHGKMTDMPFSAWVALFIIGAGGSAAATVLFTASFRHINPSVAILIQKIQPVLVVIFAFLFLRETPKRGFWAWALVALASVTVISFPELNFGFIFNGGVDWHSKGVLYAAAAAGIWAIATVAGKWAVNSVPPSIVTFWRYLFGLVALVVVMTAARETVPPWEVLKVPAIYQSLLYMAFVPGILSLVCYYNGLQRTTATTATFVELIWPISAVILSWIFLKQSLAPVQIFAGVVLLYSVIRISSEA